MTIAERAAELGPWFQSFTFSDGSTVGKWDTKEKLAGLFSTPDAQEVLIGNSVLDIGCMAGEACLWARENGANDVWGVDPDERSAKQFKFVMDDAKPLNVGFQQRSVYDLLSYYDPQEFDVVIMMGVYYHLLDPLLALQNAWELTGRLLVVEGEVCQREDCVAEFYPGEYKGDASNWWVPSVSCFEAWLTTLPGSRVEIISPLRSISRIGARVWRD